MKVYVVMYDDGYEGGYGLQGVYKDEFAAKEIVADLNKRERRRGPSDYPFDGTYNYWHKEMEVK